MKSEILAAASLIGTIIGAGVFGIPYVLAQSGVLTSVFYFVILGVTVILIHLFFGEIVFVTEGKHRLVGYTERYLGKRAKKLVATATILGTGGALLAYIILGGDFLKIIFGSSVSSFQLSLILWIVLSFFVFLGIRSIALSELLMNLGFFTAIILVFVFSAPHIKFENFRLFNSANIFLPYGVILFSLIGWNAIPEIKGILKNEKDLKKVIIFSLIGCCLFYFLFGLIISGVSGAKTSQDAFQGLVPILGDKIMILGGVFGLLAVSTSFLVLANYLKNTLIFDFKVPRFLSFATACSFPLILFLLGVKEFIWVIAIVGSFMGLVEGGAISLMYQKAKRSKRAKTMVWATIIILSVGALSHAFQYFF